MPRPRSPEAESTRLTGFLMAGADARLRLVRFTAANYAALPVDLNSSGEVCRWSTKNAGMERFMDNLFVWRQD
jgi:hypothetical protein